MPATSFPRRLPLPTPSARRRIRTAPTVCRRGPGTRGFWRLAGLGGWRVLTLPALAFWAGLLDRRNRGVGQGAGVLYLFGTAVHAGLRGALLTFSQTVWYPHYAATAPAWGLTALEDQQLGGLIMWVPAGVSYLAGALGLLAAALAEAERRDRRRGANPASPP